MGLFSFFKKSEATATTPAVPSEEQQKQEAVKFVDAFLDELYSDFDKEGAEEYSTSLFRIAGITHHCTKKDIGFISGISFPHNNPYDKTAIALGRVQNGRVSDIFGYIAKDDKKAFNKFAGESKNLPFLGYIKPFTDDEGRTGICGLIKFYKGNCKGAYEAMIKDAKLLIGAFKGYYKEQTLEEQGETLDWILERHF